jgi:hypothetical protein
MCIQTVRVDCTHTLKANTARFYILGIDDFPGFDSTRNKIRYIRWRNEEELRELELCMEDPQPSDLELLRSLPGVDDFQTFDNDRHDGWIETNVLRKDLLSQTAWP